MKLLAPEGSVAAKWLEEEKAAEVGPRLMQSCSNGASAQP